MAQKFVRLYLAKLGLVDSAVEKYAKKAHSLSNDLDLYVQRCYGLGSWKEILPPHDRELWPPKPSAALLRQLGKLIFFPAFVASPSLLQACILVSFNCRRGFCSPAHESDHYHFQPKRPMWDFYGLITTVQRFAKEKVVTNSPYVHHADLQNIITAWDAWVQNGVLKFPSSCGLEGTILKVQQKVKLDSGCEQPYYDRNEFADEQFKNWSQSYQDLTLAIYVQMRKEAGGW